MKNIQQIRENWFQVGERIRVILDCDDNTLAFERNYEFLGVAFRGNVNLFYYHYCSFLKNLGLSNKHLYPSVNIVPYLILYSRLTR